MRVRTSIRWSHAPRQLVCAGLAAACLALAVAGCGGANERRSSGAVSGTLDPAANVPPPPAAANKGPQGPKCGVVFNFQLWNYTTGLLDPKKDPPDKKAEAVKNLEAAASQASTEVPELAPAIGITTKVVKANVNGEPKPTPAAGEPSIEDAGRKIGDWQKANNCA
jgi:hypothetical protein